MLPSRSHQQEVRWEAVWLELLRRVDRQAKLPVPRLPRHRVTPVLSAGKITSPRWERIVGR